MITPIFLAAATVLLPDGSPASGAAAVSLTEKNFAHVTGTEFARPVEPVLIAEDGTLDVTAEISGRWIILHEQGYADTAISPETSLRVFPLGTTTLFVPLEDDISYEDALALLQTIEAGEIRRPKPRHEKTGPNTWSFSFTSSGVNISAEDLLQITNIQQDKDGTLKIQTRNQSFGGRFYYFKKLPDGGFEQTGGG